MDVSEALVELPKLEAVIAKVAVVKNWGKTAKKEAKRKLDAQIKKARELFAKQMAELKFSIPAKIKVAAQEASVALKSAKKLRKIVYEPEGYESRTKLTDVLWILAKNGYEREADKCAGLNRDTWTYVPPEMSEKDKDRVRKTNMFWQAIINVKHGKLKETRLSWAASEGKLARVRELGEWRADVEAADKDGCTPLFIASQKGNLDVARELLARGANIEAAMNMGATSLIIASYYGHLDVVRELLARGANIEAANNNGATSLYIASQEGRLDVVRELLARGANIEAAANDGATSLLTASDRGHLDVVRELLARGAVVDAVFHTGFTPFIQASWKGHTEVVRALLAAGANKHHVTNNGHAADSHAGTHRKAPAGSRAAILALLA